MYLGDKFITSFTANPGTGNCGIFAPGKQNPESALCSIYETQSLCIIASHGTRTNLVPTLLYPHCGYFDYNFLLCVSQWRQNTGGICAWSMNALGFTSTEQPQDNWLFSQHISYMDANEIFFNVSLDFSVCLTNPGCDDHFTLHRYDTNGTVVVAQRTNPQNYETLMRLEHRPENLGGGFTTFSFVRPEPRTTGFYLGIQDDGTQGIIGRVIVFYHVARGRREDLLTCPDVPFPVQGANVNSQESCSCVANANSAGATLVRSCNDNGVCNENQVCGCNPGFQLQLMNGINTCTGTIIKYMAHIGDT